MRTAVLIRHGAVVGDADRRFIGATDWPMSREGEAEIRRLGERLGALFPIHAIHCSDLARSRRTAELLAVGPKTAIAVHPALREIDLGQWEGRLRAEVARSAPLDYERRGRDIVGFRPPGGESFADLAARVLPCWRDLVEDGGTQIVAIAGHAGVNRVILCHLLAAPLANLFRIAQRPACLNVVEWRKNEPVVTLVDGDCL